MSPDNFPNYGRRGAKDIITPTTKKKQGTLPVFRNMGLRVETENREVSLVFEMLIARHALRGADSIHLSTALWFRKATKFPVVFVASDNELLNAARAERLKILNPAEAIITG